jgi:hypothetical protein
MSTSAFSISLSRIALPLSDFRSMEMLFLLRKFFFGSHLIFLLLDRRPAAIKNFLCIRVPVDRSTGCG